MRYCLTDHMNCYCLNWLDLAGESIIIIIILKEVLIIINYT